MPRKAEPDARSCARCGRTIEWRKKWSRCWHEVRYCSDRCRRHRLGDDDLALERAIAMLLERRARDATICPSEAARIVRPDDWSSLMAATRSAARRMCARGAVEIVQRGQVVDPSSARGPIRLRLASRAPETTDGVL